jgi:hypothetical protein
MKIKGVKAKDNRGDAVEYSPEEKVPLAVHDASCVAEEFKGFLTFVKPEDVKVEKMTFGKKGDPLEGRYQNNSYVAEGSAIINRRKKETNQVHQPKTLKFKIEFHDCLDEISMPDLKVTKFATFS